MQCRPIPECNLPKLFLPAKFNKNPSSFWVLTDQKKKKETIVDKNMAVHFFKKMSRYCLSFKLQYVISVEI